MIKREAWPLVAAMVGVLATSAAGQQQIDLQRFQRQLEQIQRETRLLIKSEVPAAQRALVDYGGYLTFNFLSIDDIDGSTHILRQTSATGYARVNIDEVHEFFGRVRTTYLDWNEGDAFDGHGDNWVEPTLDRAHYRFDLGRYYEAYEGRQIDGNVVFQGGRQLVHWVNGLTLSEEIDGAQTTFSMGPLSLRTVAGRTRQSNSDLDSSRREVSNSYKRGFFGGMLALQASPKHHPFVYGLVQEDFNNEGPYAFDIDGDGIKGDPDDIPTRFQYDSYYIGAGSTGSLGDRMVYGVEVVYQGGEGFSNSLGSDGAALAQTQEDIEAFAADVRLDYLITGPNRTRLGAELLVASGDDDRINATTTFGGNRSGTDDNAFQAFGLLNTGLAFNQDVTNLIMLRLGASTFPLPNSNLFRRFQIGTNLFVFGKYDNDAPTSEDTLNSDGTPTRTTDRLLGFEADVFTNWQITSDVTWTIRYGAFFPGKGLAGDSDPRHLFFTGLTLAF